MYDVISSHGREEELLYYANAINDYNYVLSYWVQRERWLEALAVLKKQTDPEIFYRYSSVLMIHAAAELVEVLMSAAQPEGPNLIPALLEYDRIFKGPISQNQAIRYLQYVVGQLNSTDSAIHNTSSPSTPLTPPGTRPPCSPISSLRATNLGSIPTLLCGSASKTGVFSRACTSIPTWDNTSRRLTSPCLTTRSSSRPSSPTAR